MRGDLTFAADRSLSDSRFRPAAMALVPVERTAAFRGLRRLVLASVLAAALLAGGTGLLLARTVVAGAVVSQGLLVVDTGAKTVQSATAETVAQLLVIENQRVTAGQPVIMLDSKVAQGQLRAIATSLVQQRLRLARLVAERDEASQLAIVETSDLTVLAPATVQAIVETETKQFQLRRAELDVAEARLREQIEQEREATRGRIAQTEATDASIDLVRAELETLQTLLEQQLVSAQRVSELQRELSALTGLKGELDAAVASGRGRLAELELQISQLGQSQRAGLTDDIAAAQQAIARLEQELLAAQEALEHLVLVAPQTGFVHDLAIHTVGGVVQPAQVLMLIVPEHDQLVGEVRIRPSDIDQLYPGQPATVHFTAFDRGTTPAFDGMLSSISPDLSVDPQSGAGYYRARIEIDTAALAAMPDLRLVPGMPVEVHVRTAERTLLSYFTKPLTDQMNRAFR